MSNYIVKSESIGRIANFIEVLANNGFNTFTLSLPEETRRALTLCVDKYGSMDAKKVARQLAIMNCLAVDNRYNKNMTVEEYEAYYLECEKATKREDTQILYPRWEGRRVLTKEHMQLYKNIQCYNYQTDEDATYKSDLFKGMKALENAFCSWIVSNSAEYNDCNWE